MAQPIPSSLAGRTDSCLGRTCLKWAEDGELTPLDQQLVLERLCRADAAARSLLTSAAGRSAPPSAHHSGDGR